MIITSEWEPLHRIAIVSIGGNIGEVYFLLKILANTLNGSKWIRFDRWTPSSVVSVCGLPAANASTRTQFI